MFWERYVSLSDDELVQAAEDWAASERRKTLEILGILIVMDNRDVSEKRGFSTLFKFCTEKLRFSEAMAFWRIRTARAAKEYPRIADELQAGTMNITTVTILSSYLTAANSEELISEASGKTRRELEAYLASLAPSAPRLDVVTRHGPTVVAKAQWPAPSPPLSCSAPATGPLLPDVVEALDAVRRRLHFDVGPDTAQLIERAREILRHKFPFASLEDIVREALNVLLDHKDLARNLENGRGQETETEGRGIPMWVRRAVWKRDDGRCAYVAPDGKSCGDKSWLEFDHKLPFAKGGRSDDPENIRLLCRAHNQFEARRAFGPEGRA